MKKILLALLVVSQANFASGQSFRPGNQSFEALYNNVRFAQPTNVPWAGSYWAFGNDGIAVPDGGISPAAIYDQTFGRKSEAWEKGEHTCSNLTGEDKAGCEAWWGHCNAWSAAAIKEPEPRKSISYQGKEFTVAHQKGLLTELWMASGALFEGNTDKRKKTGDWINTPGSESYDAFWDVSPRTFFLIFTNYVGLMKQGVVIDRFTGDQVWNQPIVGYRILPIHPANREKTLNGATVYANDIAMKIYWANDGVSGGHVSQPFSIKSTNDTESTESFGNDYDARLLKFTLYFDAKVLMNADGTVASAGNIVGQGVWDHQINPRGNMDQKHPDFIWQPTNLSYGGMQNPEVLDSNVRQVIKARVTENHEPDIPEVGPGNGNVNPPPVVPPPPANQIVVVFNRSSNFEFATIFDIKFKIQNILSREGITQPFTLTPAGAGGADLKLVLPMGNTSRDAVVKLLNEAGIKTNP